MSETRGLDVTATRSRRDQSGLIRQLLISTHLLVVAAAFAQPADTSQYDLNSTVEIKGMLVQYALKVPGSVESILYIKADDKNGESHQWAVVLGNSSEVMKAGTTIRSFSPGQNLVVTGNPSKDASEHRILAEKITRPDGSVWNR
jgi:hypothetical protein